MRCDARQVPLGRLAAPLQFKREHQHGKLRLPVSLPRIVEPFALQVSEVDHARPVREAAEADHARAGSHPKQRQKVRRQSKMREIVDAELHFELVRGWLAPRNGHYPALLTSRWRAACVSAKRRAKSRTAARFARSQRWYSTFTEALCWRIFTTASLPFASLRPVSTTSAPALARARAVSNPSPPVPPVTSASLPD